MGIFVKVISCCDSRVDPGVLFDLGQGDIFVIRNVVNLIPPYETKGDYHGTSAALQAGCYYDLRSGELTVLDEIGYA